MAEYRLSVRARAQLLGIYDYTNTTFGQYQAEAYHAGLESTFSLLADFPRIGQSVDELAPRCPAVSVSNTTSSTLKKLPMS
jgi:toxin ParE1/3/4